MGTLGRRRDAHSEVIIEVVKLAAAVIAFSVGASIAACGAFGGDDPAAADAGSDAAVEAAPDAPAGPGDGGPGDSSDAEPACSPLNPVAAPLGDARWVKRGSAALVDDTVVLTTKDPSLTGAVWWAEQHKLDAFEATFQVRINLPAAGPGGDGLAFVWTEATNVPTVGGGGGNMGACGLSGYAVAIDTAPDAADAGAGPTLKLMATSTAAGCPNTPLSRKSVPAAADGAFHTVRVTVVDGAVTLHFDSVMMIQATLTPAPAFTGYAGFTAATGGQIGEHIVRAPTIGFPREPSCP
jgi:hypothetical protein